MFDALGPAPLDPSVKVLLSVWIVLLVPWALVALVVGMALDGGPTFGAYLLIWSVLSYPALVGLVFYYRRRNPRLIWLPVLSFAGGFFALPFLQNF